MVLTDFGGKLPTMPTWHVFATSLLMRMPHMYDDKEFVRPMAPDNSHTYELRAVPILMELAGSSDQR